MANQTPRRGATRADDAQHSLPGPALSFFAGLATGVILVLVAGSLMQSDSQAPPTAEQDAEPAEEASQASNFQFYTLLNETEVTVPDTQTPPASEDRTVYWLQAGSFRNKADADALRASLLLLNLEARISQVNHQGNLWYRVMVGAFESRTKMAAARETLLEHDIQPLLLMEKGQDNADS